MDHRRIEEENVAELYATGQLSPAAEEDFEVHLMSCRECRERVARADEFRVGMRTVAAEEAARVVVQTGVLAQLRRSRGVRRGLAAVVLLGLAALPAWLLRDRARLAGELAAAREALEHPTPSPSPVALPDQAPMASPDHSRRELERLAREKGRLEEALAEERGARSRLAEQLARLTRSQGNTLIFSLGLVRGESAPDEVTLGPAPEWIVLSLELPAVEHQSYRVRLLDGRGATVWQGDGLEPTAADTLTVLLHTDGLAPGGYRFVLEGRDAAGRPSPAGEIPFRVRRAPAR